MQRASLASLLLTLSTLGACGEAVPSADDAAATSRTLDAPAVIHKIQPLGVATSCFGSNERVIRDHRVQPPRVYSEYVLGMKDCSPPASSLVIQMLGGQPWVGGYSFVTIKKNGLCLTNPVTYAAGGTDVGETFWRACTPQNGASAERFRQQWVLVFNTHNAAQIQSRAAIDLGLPNAQLQCLDRQDPTTVKRVACTLNNWQVVRAN
jgi:hypothetical protein